MKTKLMLLMTGLMTLTAHADPGAITAGFGYGNVFSNPKEINTVIDLTNTLAGSAAPHIEDAAKISLYSDYQVNDEWALGLSYATMTPWTSSVGTIGGSVFSGRLETSTTLVGLRAKYTLLKSGVFSAYLVPTLGLAFYSTDYNDAVSATRTRVSASTTGIMGGLSVTGKASLNKTIGLAVDLGYQFAKSGTLKVDSQSGTSLAPGADYISLGNPMKLDLSGVYIAAGIEFSFDTAVASGTGK